MADLDREIAVTVFGKYQKLLPFSTNISAAWLVVEKMRERGFIRFELISDEDYGGKIGYSAIFVLDNDSLRMCKMSDSAPDAICKSALAALKAIGDG